MMRMLRNTHCSGNLSSLRFKTGLVSKDTITNVYSTFLGHLCPYGRFSFDMSNRWLTPYPKLDVFDVKLELRVRKFAFALHVSTGDTLHVTFRTSDCFRICTCTTS